MRRDFDGLNAILGNSPALSGEPFAGRAGDATGTVATVAPRADAEVSLRQEVSEPDGLEELDGGLGNPVSDGGAGGEGEALLLRPRAPTAPAAAADPLLALDRGVFEEGVHAAAETAGTDAGITPSSRAGDPTIESLLDDLLELDRGVYDPGSRPAPSPLPIHAPLARRSPDPAARSAELHVHGAARPDAPHTRQTGGWLAVAVVLGGMVLGGAAAVAVFHEQVSQIVAQWATRQDSRTPQAPGAHAQKAMF